MAVAEVEDATVDLEADSLALAATAYQDPVYPSGPSQSISTS